MSDNLHVSRRTLVFTALRYVTLTRVEVSCRVVVYVTHFTGEVEVGLLFPCYSVSPVVSCFIVHKKTSF